MKKLTKHFEISLSIPLHGPSPCWPRKMEFGRFTSVFGAKLVLNSKKICGKNNRIMKVLDKGMKVPKVIRPKIRQIPPKFIRPIFSTGTNFWDIVKKGLRWTSIGRDMEL